MKRKGLSLVFIFMILSQTIFSSLGLPLQANAEPFEHGIFKHVTFINKDGNVIDVDGAVESAAMVNIDWSVEDLDVKPGNDFSLTLPKEVNMETDQQGSLTASDHLEVATFYASTDGTVVVTFNEEIESHLDASGTFSIKTMVQDDTEVKDAEIAPEKSIDSNSESEEEEVDKESTEAEVDEGTEDRENSRKKETNEIQSSNSVNEKTLRLTNNGIITENILTDVELGFEDKNGNPIEQPGLDSLVNVKYKWALENNHGYQGGMIFVFHVPEELNIYNVIEREEMKFNGEVIGYLSVSQNGEATIEFTEFIEQYSNINGTMEIWTELSEDIIVTDDREVTITPIEGSESITIPIDFKPGGPTIDKKGTPNKDYNAETIDWTVDFNKHVNKIENAVLSDPIQAGQQLKDGTIKLYHLIVKLNGTVEQGAEVDPGDYTIGKTADGKDFIIDFKGDINTAYRLVYETEITDDEQERFENKATLIEDGKEVGNATATVGVKRGSPLEKEAIAYDADQTITWEVRYNYNEKEIAHPVLEDFFDDSHELVDDSFTVYKIIIDENGKEEKQNEIDSSAYSITKKVKDGKEGFEFAFKDSIDAAYKIIYQTKAKDRVFESDTIRNDVSAGEDKTYAEQSVGQYILFKSHGTPDYKDKTIEWNITFNHDGHQMNHVILTDVFTNKGLKLDPKSIKITNESGELKSPDDYELVQDEDEPDTFIINFRHTITTPHTIKYMTTFNYEQRDDKDKQYLENKVHLQWEDENGDTKEKDATARFTPDEYTQSNGFKYGSYNAVTKEITWNIGINYNEKTLNHAVVEDFILGNQKPIKDSIKIYEMALTGGANGTEVKEAIPGEDYSISWIENENGDPGFRIEFKDEIDQPYMVTYKTSLQGLEFVEDKYENTATLYNGSDKETDLNAAVNIPHGGKYTTKTGTQNGKIIDWQVNINFDQSQVSGATIIDTPSENQSLLENSFHLYTTTVDEKGEVTIGEALTLNEDYTLELNKNPDSFKLKFKNEINEPYILEYQSLILAKPGEQINNNILFTGEHMEPGDEEKTSHQVRVERTAGMGDGAGEIGSLKLIKTDATTDEKLEGATFSLRDQDSGIVIKEGTTGQDGVVTFDRLLYGDYLLVENEAPEGYLSNDEEMVITIDQPYVEGSEEKIGNVKTIENQKIIRAVELTKVDSKDNNVKLEGATFELQKKVGDHYQTIDNLTTDEDGILYKEGLDPGEYQFVEIAAPDGYLLSKEPIKFTIVEKQIEVIKLTAENVKLGSVELVKLDEDDKNKVLADAIFKLIREDGSVVHEALKTDKNGKIFVSNLQSGNYKFIEVKAPEYYQLNKEPIEFTVKVGEIEAVSVEAPNKLILGKVELTKVDENDNQQLLEGAVFELQDIEGNVLKSDLTTNSKGKIVVEDLKPGKYQFIEIQSPEHYQLNKEPIEFKIDKSKTEAAIKLVTVTAENKLIPGSVELTKVDKTDNSVTLPGAKFELQDAHGNTIKENVITDEEGKLIIGDLNPGKYQFVETKAPEYYKLDKTVIPFEIEKSQNKMLTVEAVNELITGSVELVKVDLDNDHLPLAKAVFELQNEHGEALVEGLTTNEQGKIVVDNLKPGNYQFVEMEAPFGYELDQTPIQFTIDRSKTETDVKLITVKAINELIPGSVELIKVDKDNIALTLKGTEFELQDTAGNTLQEGLETDKDGKLMIDNLKPGDYQFVETKATFGYELDQTPIKFTIVKGQKERLTVTVENKLITGSVELIKVDKDNHDLTLAGAEFELQDTEGNILQKGLTTDKEGKLLVDNLKPGNYQFVETKAPAGYELDQTPIQFKIAFSQEEKLVIVVPNKSIPKVSEGPETPNDPETSDKPGISNKPEGPNNNQVTTVSKHDAQDKLPQTGEALFMYLMIVGLCFMAMGGVLLFRRKRKPE